MNEAVADPVSMYRKGEDYSLTLARRKAWVNDKRAGRKYRWIAKEYCCGSDTVSKWVGRFEKQGEAGLRTPKRLTNAEKAERMDAIKAERKFQFRLETFQKDRCSGQTRLFDDEPFRVKSVST